MILEVSSAPFVEDNLRHKKKTKVTQQVGREADSHPGSQTPSNSMEP